MSDGARPDASARKPRQRRCPLCGASAEPRFRPFCSARCRDIDLGRWFSGAYAVPAVEGDDETDEDGEFSGRDG